MSSAEAPDPEAPRYAQPQQPEQPAQPAQPRYALPVPPLQQPQQPGAAQPYQPGQWPPPGYVTRPRTGGVAWGLGFLALIPIPIVGTLVTVGVVLGVGLSQRKHGSPVATANGRNAANWALTYLLIVLAAWATIVVAGLAAEPATDSIPPIVVVGLLLFFGGGITHLVVTITGLVKAGRGEVQRGPGIPFFRG